MLFRSQLTASALALFLTGWGWAQAQPQPGYPQSTPGGVQNSPGANPGAVPPLTTPTEQQPADPMAADKSFVKEAAQADATQVELGRLAQEKGSSDAVKEFGKRMVETHTQTAEELKRAAAKASIPVPAETPRKVKKTGDKLAKLSGQEFDRAYTKIVLNEHKDGVKTFAREAQAGQSPDVREYASRTLPKLQEERQLAAQLETGAKSGSKSK
jgi:putative membrane protein